MPNTCWLVQCHCILLNQPQRHDVFMEIISLQTGRKYSISLTHSGWDKMDTVLEMSSGQMMAWRWTGDKSIIRTNHSLVLLTHTCIAQLPWVKPVLFNSLVESLCHLQKLVDQGWGAVSYSSLSITPVKIYSSSYLVKRWFPMLNFYLNLTRKQTFSIIMDICQVKLSQNEDICWVDFYLSNTQAWERNSTPPLPSPILSYCIINIA